MGCIGRAATDGSIAALRETPALPEPAAFASLAECAPLSASSVLILGAGAEGNVRDADASLTSTASAGRFATDFAKSPLCGSAPSRRMVASSIGPPQWLREQLGPHSQLR